VSAELLVLIIKISYYHISSILKRTVFNILKSLQSGRVLRLTASRNNAEISYCMFKVRRQELKTTSAYQYAFMAWTGTPLRLCSDTSFK